RLIQWKSLFAAPGQIATIILVPYLVSGTRPYQLGLNLHDWPRNLILGWLGWVILSPVVFGLYLASEWAVQLFWHVSPEEHPFFHICRPGSLDVERLAIFFSAAIRSPLLAQLLCRGLSPRG